MDTLSLKGELLVGWIRGARRKGFVLTDYRVCKIEGRAFISGRLYYPTYPADDGLLFHVPLDEVQYIYEYETKESFDERKKIRPRKRKKLRLFLIICLVLMAFVIGNCLP